MTEQPKDEAQIAALQDERARVAPSGDTDRLKAIDEQLKLYGHVEAAEKRKAAAEDDDPAKAKQNPPQGRTAPGKQTS